VFATSPIALAFLCLAVLSIAYAVWQRGRVEAFTPPRS
jgi:hypothetical protein